MAESAALYADISKTDDVRRCVVCGKPLQAKSGRAKYCPRCANIVRKAKVAVYVSRHREKNKM